MTSFELRSSICDGHIKVLARTIALASRISGDLLVEFTSEQMRLSAKSDLYLLKFVFTKEFFADYKCDRRHRCYVSSKALLGPAKCMVRLEEDYRKSSTGSPIRVNCSVEDELNNQIIVKIGTGHQLTGLTYRIYINDLSRDQMNIMDAINRTIEYWRVEISPKEDMNGHYLMTMLKDLPSMVDQVIIRCSPSEIRFTGTTSPTSRYYGLTSMYVQKRDKFRTFNVREATNITVPLKVLKQFVRFTETNKINVNPMYTFEGFGMPAHFAYNNPLFKSYFICSTSIDFIPDTMDSEANFTSPLLIHEVEEHSSQEQPLTDQPEKNHRETEGQKEEAVIQEHDEELRNQEPSLDEREIDEEGLPDGIERQLEAELQDSVVDYEFEEEELDCGMSSDDSFSYHHDDVLVDYHIADVLRTAAGLKSEYENTMLHLG